MRYDIPPPGFLARNYTQRPKSHFSPQARQLLFDFTTSRTQCELGEAPRRPAAQQQKAKLSLS